MQEQQDSKGDEEEDERNIADLLIDQIEFADIIVLNKMDLVSEAQLQELKALLRILNPGADVIPATEAKVNHPPGQLTCPIVCARSTKFDSVLWKWKLQSRDHDTHHSINAFSGEQGLLS